jgi:hypothetical protein
MLNATATPEKKYKRVTINVDFPETISPESLSEELHRLLTNTGLVQNWAIKQPKAKSDKPKKPKVKKVSFIEMDYHAFEKLVEKHIPALKNDGQHYSFVETEECGNDSQHTFNGITGKPDSEYDKKEIAMIIAGTAKYFGNHQVLEALCSLGAVEPGDYLITVCW